MMDGPRTNHSMHLPQPVNRSSPSDALFQSLANSLPNTLVWSSTSDGSLVFVNDHWHRIIGSEAIDENLINGSWSRYIHPEDLIRWQELWQAIDDESGQQEIELRLLGSDGRHRWFRIHLDPVFGAQTSGIRWIGRGIQIERDRSQDRSESVDADATIHVSNATIESMVDPAQRYRLLFESIDQGFCLVRMIFDEHRQPIDYRIVEGNAAFRELTGLSEIGDKPIREFLPDLEFWWVETYGRIAMTGTPERFEYFAAPMSKWFEVFAFRFGEPQNFEVAIFFKDVTARRQSDAEIAEYRRRLDTALIAGEVGTFEWDVAHDRVWGDPNFSRIINMQMNEDGSAKIDDYMDVIHPDDRMHVSNLIDKTLSTGCDFVAEYRILQQDSMRWVVSRGKVVHDANGKDIRFPGIVIDITKRKQAEALLRRSQERLRLAQQVTGIGTFEWNMQNGSIEWSPELESLYGMPLGGFDGTYDAWIAHVHPEDRTATRERVHESLSTSQLEAQFRIIRCDGVVRWLAARGKVDKNDAGDPVRMLGINIDVTDRELASRALRESEERFRDLANAMPQLVWTANDDGEVTYYNSQASRYQGIKQTDEGRWNWRPILHPDDVQLTIATWQDAVSSGQTYECEHRVHMQDGGFRWHLSRAFRLIGSKRSQWYGTATDIHEMKLAEQAMRESEERFRMLADNMSQFAWMADREGGIFWFNRRWFDYTGTTSEAMENHGWLSFIHPDYVESVIDNLKQSFHAGTDWEDTFPIRGSDGDYCWFLCRAVPIRDEDGNITRWFGTNTDVTEFRRIEAELRRAQQLAEVANQAKSDFLANMSHEIRSPMTAILGYADLLTTEDAGDREKIQTIRSNGQYLLTLINDILDLSKIEAGKLGLDLIEFNPRLLIEEVHFLMQVRADESNLAFSQEFATAIPKNLKSDPIRIRQVLINLVGNAIKFTESGSVKMVVRFDSDNSELVVDVIDTGIGIGPNELQRLFQPFSQADATISRRFGGSGLGLAISQRLAGLLHGRIEVQSELGRGSRFSLILPVSDDAELEFATLQKQKTFVENPSVPLTIDPLKIRVLVVEDRRDVRFLIQSFISKFGGQTVLCENGAEAIALIESDQVAGNVFDVVLMDMQMPVMDGLTAVGVLRSRGYDRPIIALTANARQSDRELCLQAGYTDHLCKPIDVQQLLDILRRHADNDKAADS